MLSKQNPNSELAELMMASAIHDRSIGISHNPVEPYPNEVIVRIACEVCGIRQDLFHSRCRLTEIVHARRLVAIYLKANTSLSYSTISFLTGNRNHASVVSDVKRHNAFMQFDKEYQYLVDQFKLKLKMYSTKYRLNMNPVFKRSTAN